MKTRLLTLIVALGLTPVALLAAKTKGAEPAVVSQGRSIQIADYLVTGKTTVVDFTSQYCPPCRAYAEPLHLLHTKRADIAVVKVDINRPGVKAIDWKSPVAQQFGLRSIPHFQVYGPNGKLLAEGEAARQMVDRWIAAAK